MEDIICLKEKCFLMYAKVQDVYKRQHLMFDAVINHVSKASDWFKGYLEHKEPYKEFFITSDPNADYSKVIRPRTRCV